MGWDGLSRIGVDKSSSHHLSQNATDGVRFENVRPYLKDECRSGTLRTWPLPSKRGGVFHRASHPNVYLDQVAGREKNEREKLCKLSDEEVVYCTEVATDVSVYV